MGCGSSLAMRSGWVAAGGDPAAGPSGGSGALDAAANHTAHLQQVALKAAAALERVREEERLRKQLSKQQKADDLAASKLSPCGGDDAADSPLPLPHDHDGPAALPAPPSHLTNHTHYDNNNPHKPAPNHPNNDSTQHQYATLIVQTIPTTTAGPYQHCGTIPLNARIPSDAHDNDDYPIPFSARDGAPQRRGAERPYPIRTQLNSLESPPTEDALPPQGFIPLTADPNPLSSSPFLHQLSPPPYLMGAVNPSNPSGGLVGRRDPQHYHHSVPCAQPRAASRQHSGVHAVHVGVRPLDDAESLVSHEANQQNGGVGGGAMYLRQFYRSHSKGAIRNQQVEGGDRRNGRHYTSFHPFEEELQHHYQHNAQYQQMAKVPPRTASFCFPSASNAGSVSSPVSYWPYNNTAVGSNSQQQHAAGPRRSCSPSSLYRSLSGSHSQGGYNGAGGRVHAVGSGGWPLYVNVGAPPAAPQVEAPAVVGSVPDDAPESATCKRSGHESTPSQSYYHRMSRSASATRGGSGSVAELPVVEVPLPPHSKPCHGSTQEVVRVTSGSPRVPPSREPIDAQEAEGRSMAASTSPVRGALGLTGSVLDQYGTPASHLGDGATPSGTCSDDANERVLLSSLGLGGAHSYLCSSTRMSPQPMASIHPSVTGDSSMNSYPPGSAIARVLVSGSPALHPQLAGDSLLGAADSLRGAGAHHGLLGANKAPPLAGLMTIVGGPACASRRVRPPPLPLLQPGEKERILGERAPPPPSLMGSGESSPTSTSVNVTRSSASPPKQLASTTLGFSSSAGCSGGLGMGGVSISGELAHLLTPSQGEAAGPTVGEVSAMLLNVALQSQRGEEGVPSADTNGDGATGNANALPSACGADGEGPSVMLPIGRRGGSVQVVLGERGEGIPSVEREERSLSQCREESIISYIRRRRGGGGGSPHDASPRPPLPTCTASAGPTESICAGQNDISSPTRNIYGDGLLRGSGALGTISRACSFGNLRGGGSSNNHAPMASDSSNGTCHSYGIPTNGSSSGALQHLVSAAAAIGGGFYCINATNHSNSINTTTLLDRVGGSAAHAPATCGGEGASSEGDHGHLMSIVGTGGASGSTHAPDYHRHIAQGSTVAGGPLMSQHYCVSSISHMEAGSLGLQLLVTPKGEQPFGDGDIQQQHIDGGGAGRDRQHLGQVPIHSQQQQLCARSDSELVRWLRPIHNNQQHSLTQQAHPPQRRGQEGEGHGTAEDGPLFSLSAAHPSMVSPSLHGGPLAQPSLPPLPASDSCLQFGGLGRVGSSTATTATNYSFSSKSRGGGGADETASSTARGACQPLTSLPSGTRLQHSTNSLVGACAFSQPSRLPPPPPPPPAHSSGGMQ